MSLMSHLKRSLKMMNWWRSLRRTLVSFYPFPPVCPSSLWPKPAVTLPSSFLKCPGLLGQDLPSRGPSFWQDWRVLLYLTKPELRKRLTRCPYWPRPSLSQVWRTHLVSQCSPLPCSLVHFCSSPSLPSPLACCHPHLHQDQLFVCSRSQTLRTWPPPDGLRSPTYCLLRRFRLE